MMTDVLPPFYETVHIYTVGQKGLFLRLNTFLMVSVINSQKQSIFGLPCIYVQKGVF